MERVLRRPQAQDDIDDIWNYIADDNIHAADNWLDKLDEQFALLTQQPLMGRARDELSAGIRSFPLGRYVIFIYPGQMALMWFAFCIQHEMCRSSLVKIE